MIALCLLFLHSLNENAHCIDLTSVLSIYAGLVCVCVWWGYYTFHFSSQVFILRSAVLESSIKDALSALDPYLDGKNLDLKLELNAIIR